MKTVVVSYMTYKTYATRYGIKLTRKVFGVRRRKSMRDLSREIKNYEKNHKVRNGLYY